MSMGSAFEAGLMFFENPLSDCGVGLQSVDFPTLVYGRYRPAPVRVLRKVHAYLMNISIGKIWHGMTRLIRSTVVEREF